MTEPELVSDGPVVLDKPTVDVPLHVTAPTVEDRLAALEAAVEKLGIPGANPEHVEAMLAYLKTLGGQGHHPEDLP